jgi:hypothetical protein
VPVKVEVLDAEAATLPQPHTRPIQEPGQEGEWLGGRVSVQPGQQVADLGRREDDRQPRCTPGPHRVDPLQRQFQHGPVEEQESAERLVLGACRHPAIHSQMGEERLDLPFPQVARMSPGVLLLVEPDVLVDPAEVGLFRVEGVVEEPELVPDLVVELHGCTRAFMSTSVHIFGPSARVFRIRAHQRG